MYFLERIIFHFPPRKNIFSTKINAILPDGTRQIIFQRDFSAKTIISEHLKEISYFLVFLFLEEEGGSSFISRLEHQIIFFWKRNIIFSNDTRNIIFQCDFFGKTILSEHLKRESVVFHAAGLYCFSFINVKLLFPEDKQRDYLLT